MKVGILSVSVAAIVEGESFLESADFGAAPYAILIDAEATVLDVRLLRGDEL